MGAGLRGSAPRRWVTVPVTCLPAGLSPSLGALRSWRAPSSREMTETGDGDEHEIKIRIEAEKKADQTELGRSPFK